MTSNVEQLTLLGSLTPLYLITESIYDNSSNLLNTLSSYSFVKAQFFTLFLLFRKTIGSGFLYLQGLFIMFFIDACLTDDEPL